MPNPAKSAGSLWPARVLVVEDDEAVNDVLTEFLVDNGFEVASARDGLKAVDFLGRARFDAVLLDLVVPGASGVEILQRLRTEQPELAVIVVSGHVGMLDGRRFKEMGASRVLPKPVDFPGLLAALREVTAPAPRS